MMSLLVNLFNQPTPNIILKYFLFYQISHSYKIVYEKIPIFFIFIHRISDLVLAIFSPYTPITGIFAENLSNIRHKNDKNIARTYYFRHNN